MGGDPAEIEHCLNTVNYYRLSGYWHPFLKGGDRFVEGTDFSLVWSRYLFDRKLRLLAMDALERVEVAVRTSISYHHAIDHGAFAYAEDRDSMPKFNKARKHSDFVRRVSDQASRSKEVFSDHFFQKYGDWHEHLPVWMATELMTFGTLLTFFNGCTHRVKQAVASLFNVSDVVLGSWLLSLNTVRNICAHHGRLWNRVLGTKPMIPRACDYPEWHEPITIENHRIFAVLSICAYCLDLVSPASSWKERFHDLVLEFDRVPISLMGFPRDWSSSPIWVVKG